MKTLITRKTQLKISALSKTSPIRIFTRYVTGTEAHNFKTRLSVTQLQKNRKNSHDTYVLNKMIFNIEKVLSNKSFLLFSIHFLSIGVSPMGWSRFSFERFNSGVAVLKMNHIKLFPQCDEHLFFSVPGVRNH